MVSSTTSNPSHSSFLLSSILLLLLARLRRQVWTDPNCLPLVHTLRRVSLEGYHLRENFRFPFPCAPRKIFFLAWVNIEVTLGTVTIRSLAKCPRIKREDVRSRVRCEGKSQWRSLSEFVTIYGTNFILSTRVSWDRGAKDVPGGNGITSLDLLCTVLQAEQTFYSPTSSCVSSCPFSPIETHILSRFLPLFPPGLFFISRKLD